MQTDRTYGLGARCGSAFGEAGIQKRLDALSGLTRIAGASLLDVGCGNGVYTTRLAEAFDRVEAIDVEPDRLADFRTAIAGTPLADKVRIQQMDASQMDFDDASFDVVTAIEVVEHIPDLDGAVAEIRRVLRPGGHFLITTPNRWFPLETHGVLIGKRRLSPVSAPFVTWCPPLHRRVSDARAFTRGELVRLLGRHGFELSGGSYIFPPFDRSKLGRRVRPVTDYLERTPLRVFGLAHVVSARAAE